MSTVVSPRACARCGSEMIHQGLGGLAGVSQDGIFNVDIFQCSDRQCSTVELAAHDMDAQSEQAGFNDLV